MRASAWWPATCLCCERRTDVGGDGGVARRAGRALVLLGAALLLLGNVLWCAVHDAPTLLGVLADIRFWGLSEAFSGDHDSVAALLLLGNVLMDAYLFCVAVLALLLLRGGQGARTGPPRGTPPRLLPLRYTLGRACGGQ